LPEKRLQDERGRYLVDHSLVGLALVAGFVQDLVSLAGGQPLVPQMDGQAGQLAQRGGEGVGFGGLGAGVAGEMDGVADDNARNAEPAAEASQGAQVFPGIAAALQGEHRLRCKAQLVGHGDAYAAITDIKGQIARAGDGFQL
jgi:hypothetical protein